MPRTEAARTRAGEPVTTAATSVPREVRRAVVADAARRFKVAESAVVLTQAEQVTWNDGSLGCPQPGADVYADAREWLSNRRDQRRGSDGIPHGLPRLRGDVW